MEVDMSPPISVCFPVHRFASHLEFQKPGGRRVFVFWENSSIVSVASGAQRETWTLYWFQQMFSLLSWAARKEQLYSEGSGNDGTVCSPAMRQSFRLPQRPPRRSAGRFISTARPAPPQPLLLGRFSAPIWIACRVHHEKRWAGGSTS